MTLKDTLVKVAGKVDKVVSGFDDGKEKKHPEEMEVDPHVKASNDELSTIDHHRDTKLYQAPAPGQTHEAPGHKQSRDHPIPDHTV